MCVQCAMMAASGAAGARTFLHTRRYHWLTPRRLKRMTVAICTAAFLVSSIGFSGSGKASHHSATASAPVAVAQR
jgi:hypothetical protein